MPTPTPQRRKICYQNPENHATKVQTTRKEQKIRTRTEEEKLKRAERNRKEPNTTEKDLIEPYRTEKNKNKKYQKLATLDNFVILGEPSNLIFRKIWDFVPTEGGGSANPNFLSNFSRTNFTMVNGQKCGETHST